MCREMSQLGFDGKVFFLVKISSHGLFTYVTYCTAIGVRGGAVQ